MITHSLNNLFKSFWHRDSLHLIFPVLLLDAQVAFRDTNSTLKLQNSSIFGVVIQLYIIAQFANFIVEYLLALILSTDLLSIFIFIIQHSVIHLTDIQLQNGAWSFLLSGEDLHLSIMVAQLSQYCVDNWF